MEWQSETLICSQFLTQSYNSFFTLETGIKHIINIYSPADPHDPEPKVIYMDKCFGFSQFMFRQL